MLDSSEYSNWKPYAPNLAIASDHSGEIGDIWDASLSRWISPEQQLTDEDLGRIARNKRRTLLKRFVDIYHPLRWNALTLEQQSAVAAYRQALLDVTNQPDFPNSIEWPQRPNF